MSSGSDEGLNRLHTRLRARSAGFVLVAGVIACGVFGALSTVVANEGPAIDRKVGVTAILALILAATALVRRSWARVPLVVACACACAGTLVNVAFFAERDPSYLSYLLDFLFFNAVMVLAAAVALVVMLLDSPPRPSD